MKRIVPFVLTAVLMLTLVGCGQKPDTAPAPETAPAPTAAPAAVVTTVADTAAPSVPAGDIDTARAAYAALSAEDKQLFYAEITAEQAAMKAAWLASVQSSLYGEWNMELGTPGDNSYFAYKLVLNEDMTYEYGKQQGTWEIYEDGQIYLTNGADGVIYYIITIFEEDGFVKLLCEGNYCYVRHEDYKAAIDKKFVTVRFGDLGQYIGPLQYVGTIPPGMWDGPTGDCYIFDSLAYDMGLIYVGIGNLFEMEMTVERQDGITYTGTLYAPFEMQYLDAPYTASDIFGLRAPVYFVREEYVEEVVFVDGSREVHLTCGTEYFDGASYAWSLFPEGTYENFAY